MKTPLHCRPAAAAGFTLIEVLVALAVLGIALALVLGVFESVFGVIDHVERSAASQQRASVLFAQLQRDIGGLYKGPSGAFEAASEVKRGDGSAFLQFTTTSGLRFAPHPQPAPTVAVGYHLILSANNLDYDLYRAEIPFYFGHYDGEEKAARWLLVCERIRDFQIRYTDQYGAELDLWQARSSPRGGLPDDDQFPRAVQVDIELAEGPGADAQTGRFHYAIVVPPARLMPSAKDRD